MVNHGPTGCLLGIYWSKTRRIHILNNRMDFGTKEWLEKINGIPHHF